jgi:hypothetical protein
MYDINIQIQLLDCLDNRPAKKTEAFAVVSIFTMPIVIQALAIIVLRLIDQVHIDVAVGQLGMQQPASHMSAAYSDGESMWCGINSQTRPHDATIGWQEGATATAALFQSHR